MGSNASGGQGAALHPLGGQRPPRPRRNVPDSAAPKRSAFSGQRNPGRPVGVRRFLHTKRARKSPPVTIRCAGVSSVQGENGGIHAGLEIGVPPPKKKGIVRMLSFHRRQYHEKGTRRPACPANHPLSYAFHKTKRDEPALPRAPLFNKKGLAAPDLRPQGKPRRGIR